MRSPAGPGRAGESLCTVGEPRTSAETAGRDHLRKEENWQDSVGHSPVGEDANAGAQGGTPIGDQRQPQELALGSGRGNPASPAEVRNPG